MQLEDYFEFETFATPIGPVERIRIKGHRIDIEHVVGYFKEGFSPETILQEMYPTLNLEKIYATILYYLANKDKLEEYIRRGDEIGEHYYQEYLKQPESDVMRRLKALKAARAQQAPSAFTTNTPIQPSAIVIK